MSVPASSPLLDGIEVPQITAYLAACNWSRREGFPRPELIVFDGPPDGGGERAQIAFPSSATFSDFRRRLVDLLDALSVIEDRSPQEIALDMQRPGVDRVQARVIADFSAGGSIPLPFASVLLHGLRDLVVSAACAEEEPRPFFAKATKIGTEHAQSWRFGQTRPGSFVVTIESAVVPVTGQRSLPGATPFARRVTERIMRGLGTLDRAVLDGRPDALLASYPKGLNANMCEALLSFQSPGVPMQLEVSIQWSKQLAPPDDVAPRVRIERRGFELLDAAARSLRTPRESSERSFTGEIVKLQRESDDDRSAVLRFVEEGRRIQAKMHLGAEDYAIACDAHRDGTRVTLAGRLERVGHKQWHIFGVRGLATVDASSGVEQTRIVKGIIDR